MDISLTQHNLVRVAIVLLMIALLIGCSGIDDTDCHLTCELGIDQTEELTVGELEEKLVDAGWLLDDPDREYSAGYWQGGFSFVMETYSGFELNGEPPIQYGTQLGLDISWIGGIDPNYEAIPNAKIYNIEVSTDMTILETWIRYGIPEGGRIWPVYTQQDLDIIIWSCDRSQYYAYYDDGKRFFKAIVDRPIIVRWLFSPVIEVYPIADELNYGRSSEQRMRMYHTPCAAHMP